jgi:hypothetical protein
LISFENQEILSRSKLSLVRFGRHGISVSFTPVRFEEQWREVRLVGRQEKSVALESKPISNDSIVLGRSLSSSPVHLTFLPNNDKCLKFGNGFADIFSRSRRTEESGDWKHNDSRLREGFKCFIAPFLAVETILSIFKPRK